VEDTGIGNQAIEEIFSPFGSEYSRQTEGTGLGLAISRKLVQMMGVDEGEEYPVKEAFSWI